MLDTYAAMMREHGYIPMNHSTPYFFPVDAGPIYDDRGKKIPGHQRVFRGDSGDTLGIHTEKYTMVPYEKHFSIFEDAILASKLDKQGMQVATDMSDNGARIFRQYLFPSETSVVLDSKGQENRLALRIISFDSYDGSSAFIAKAGFFNFICANESIFGNSLINIRFRHTGDVQARVEEAAGKMIVASERFREEATRMERWPNITVDANQLAVLLEHLPQSNNTLINQFVSDFARNGKDDLWDVNQFLTSWATHGIPPKIKADRQKRVTDLVESSAWKRLETA